MGFALVTAVGWGLNWPVPKYLLTELPPLYLIVEYGVNTETNVELVPVCGGGAAMLAALKQGTIDGFALSSPTSDVAVRDAALAEVSDVGNRKAYLAMAEWWEGRVAELEFLHRIGTAANSNSRRKARD